MRQRERALGARGVLEWDPGTAGNFHYRQVLGLVALATSEQAVFGGERIRLELVGKAQMTDTDDIQVAPGSVFLARRLQSKQRSEWF